MLLSFGLKKLQKAKKNEFFKFTCKLSFAGLLTF